MPPPIVPYRKTKSWKSHFFDVFAGLAKVKEVRNQFPPCRPVLKIRIFLPFFLWTAEFFLLFLRISLKGCPYPFAFRPALLRTLYLHWPDPPLPLSVWCIVELGMGHHWWGSMVFVAFWWIRLRRIAIVSATRGKKMQLGIPGFFFGNSIYGIFYIYFFYYRLRKGQKRGQIVKGNRIL